MRYKISFDTGEKADSPIYDLGVWSIIVEEDKVMEYAEAVAMLGYSPVVDMEVTGG